MASPKTFADMKKPGRQPTPEQIAAFEETGRAASSVKTEIQKTVEAEIQEPANTERRASVNTQSREYADTEIHIPAKTEIQEQGNLPSQKSSDTDARAIVKAEARKSANTETRIAGPIVRLTIDLPESDHTRFKAVCAITKRKMVEEVRSLIERRTAELEREAGRAQ